MLKVFKELFILTKSLINSKIRYWYYYIISRILPSDLTKVCSVFMPWPESARKNTLASASFIARHPYHNNRRDGSSMRKTTFCRKGHQEALRRFLRLRRRQLIRMVIIILYWCKITDIRFIRTSHNHDFWEQLWRFRGKLTHLFPFWTAPSWSCPVMVL